MNFKIKEKRKALRMSQEELAEKANVTRATISRLENGIQPDAHIKTLNDIAIALECTIKDLVS